jgi:capsular polysaccharide biosynthesis protein
MATTQLSRPPRDVYNGDPRFQQEPPSPFQAVFRHPIVMILTIVVFAAGAFAFATLREPTWTSEARLGVGELSPSTDSAPGIVEANQQLASAYSRAASADRVLTPVSRELGLSKGAVKQRLSASPIPESPVITVKGSGPSEREAVSIAQVGTSALVRYIRELGNRNPEAERLLNELTEARGDVAELQQSAVVGAANPELDEAKLRVRSLEAQYLETTQRGGATPITELNPAETATSDSDRIMKLALVVAVLGGLAVGAALATLREMRVRRRAALAHH